MRKCGDCYNFNHKFLVLDKEYSCSQLATAASDSACGDFQSSKDSEAETPEISLKRSQVELASSEPNPVSQRENLFNTITDIFLMEQDVTLVLEKIKDEIAKQGYSLPFNGNKVEMFADKLSDLYLLYRMTLSMGMGGYLDEIMKLRIEMHFSDKRKYNPDPVAKPLARGVGSKE